MLNVLRSIAPCLNSFWLICPFHQRYVLRLTQVEGIPWTCDESDVREFFKGCGKINAVRMPRWQDSGRPRGYAHVAFAGASGARAAFGRTGQYLKGRYLTVQVRYRLYFVECHSCCCKGKNCRSVVVGDSDLGEVYHRNVPVIEMVSL